MVAGLVGWGCIAPVRSGRWEECEPTGSESDAPHARTHARTHTRTGPRIPHILRTAGAALWCIGTIATIGSSRAHTPCLPPSLREQYYTRHCKDNTFHCEHHGLGPEGAAALALSLRDNSYVPSPEPPSSAFSTLCVATKRPTIFSLGHTVEHTHRTLCSLPRCPRRPPACSPRRVLPGVQKGQDTIVEG